MRVQMCTCYSAGGICRSDGSALSVPFLLDRRSGTRSHALSADRTGLKNPYLFFTLKANDGAVAEEGEAYAVRAIAS